MSEPGGSTDPKPVRRSEFVSHPLIAALEKHGPLTEEEKDVIRQITSRVLSFEPKAEIVPEGSVQLASTLLLEGVAIRHVHLEDGERHISALHMPGDFVDLFSFLLKKMDHGVGAITACKVARVAHSDLLEVSRKFPYLTRAFWFMTLTEGATTRQWLTGVGRKSALERLAHLFCELHCRFQAIGLSEGNSFELPFTQEELADAQGLSSVHVNRTMKEMRENRLIRVEGKSLIIENLAALRELAEFNPAYLHLDQQLER
jgi:CRP-like cAMP-binding protein